MTLTCLVMAGGRGERFGNPCKFMESVYGEVILRRLLNQLREVCSWIVLAVSKHTLSCVKEMCLEVECVELPGSGYVEDLSLALSALRKPLLVVGADVVITGDEILKDFIERSMEAASRGVSVVTALVRGRDGWEPVGLAMFFGEGGRWENVKYLDGLTDIDSREKLKSISGGYV